MNYRQECKVPHALFNSKALFNPYQYEPFFKILKWNEEELKYQANNKNLLITDEVGVGKTFEVGIILMELLINNPNLSVAIICPVKLCENWEKELRDNFYLYPRNLHKTHVRGQITIIPYTHLKSGNIEDINSYNILILDEAHYIRNKNNYWNGISSLIEKKENENAIRIFMTGTPIFNKEEDYKNITELLEKNNKSFEITNTLQSEANCYDNILDIKIGMKDESNYFDNNGSIKLSTEEIEVINCIEIGNYGNLTGFLKRYSASSFNSLKKFIQKYNDKKYDEEEEEEIDALKNIEDIDNDKELENNVNLSELKAKLEKLQDKDSKLAALKALLEKLKINSTNNNFKIIVFSCFINTCKYLEDELKGEYNVYCITGETNTEKVEEYKDTFKNEDNPAVLICSDAAKEGHNLQFCQYLIHYDLPFSPAVIGQRNGRIYRKGQKNNPKVYYLPMEKGYDKRLLGEIIAEKCSIIREASKSLNISRVNILPNDSDDYLNECIEKFIDDYFIDTPNKDKNSTPCDIAKRFLKKYFFRRSTNNNIVEEKWILEEAENYYSQWDNSDISKEDIKTKIKEIYLSALKNKDTGLSDIYKKNYDKKIEACTNKWFKKDEDSTSFEDCCKKYVGDSKNNNYCFDLMNKENVDIRQYKENFKPLKEWENNGV